MCVVHVDCACERGGSDRCDVLCLFGCEVAQKGRSPVSAACHKGHVEVVKVLHGLGADVNTADEVCMRTA